MKTLQFSFLFLFIVTHSALLYSQVETSPGNENPGYIGFFLAPGFYTTNSDNVKVDPYYGINLESGIGLMLTPRNFKLIKADLSYNYFRSPFVNNVSSYEEFLNLSLAFGTFDFSITSDRSFRLLFGPRLSMLTRQGTARVGNDIYDMKTGRLGAYYKIGLNAEVSLFSEHPDFLSAFGLRMSVDISAFMIKDIEDLMVNDNYISIGIFYSLDKPFSRD